MGVTLFAPAHGHPQSALPARPSQETQLLAFSLCSWTSILSGNLGGGPISCFCHVPPLREVLGSSWQPVCVRGESPQGKPQRMSYGSTGSSPRSQSIGDTRKKQSKALMEVGGGYKVK